jgi:hypothetical protein
MVLITLSSNVLSLGSFFSVAEESLSRKEWELQSTWVISKVMHTVCFLFKNFGNNSKSGGLSPPDCDLFLKLKKPLLGKRFRSIEEVSDEVT